MPLQIEPNFSISEVIYDKCQKFALESAGTSANKYARRNQFNLEKIQKDICIGKLGEEGVYHNISPLIPNLSAPDHNIYLKKDKNWSADLKQHDTNLSIAVKTQGVDSEISYGRSWVFQIGDGKQDCDTGIFSNNLDDQHYVSFVSVNLPKRTGIIRAVVKIKWLHDNNLFQPMKLINLRSNKVAVYYEDLIKFEGQLWQL